MTKFMGTTICAVNRNGVIAVGGDGQVTMGESVIFKGNAVKVKRIYDDRVIVGFAGSVCDAFALSEQFEKMLQKYSGNLMRSAVELAKLWREGKASRQLEAMLLLQIRITCLLFLVQVKLLLQKVEFVLLVVVVIMHLLLLELCLLILT